MKLSTLIPWTALLAGSAVVALPISGHRQDSLSPRRNVYVSRLHHQRAIGGASDPVSLVNEITCNIFDLHIEDPQAAISQVQRGLLTPPAKCQCTLEVFTELIQQCLDRAEARKNFAQKNAAPKPESGRGSGTPHSAAGPPGQFAQFAGPSNSNGQPASPASPSVENHSAPLSSPEPAPGPASAPTSDTVPATTDAAPAAPDAAPPVDVTAPSEQSDSNASGSSDGSSGDDHVAAPATDNNKSAVPSNDDSNSGDVQSPVSGAGDNPPTAPAPASQDTAAQSAPAASSSSDKDTSVSGGDDTNTAAPPLPATAVSPPMASEPAPASMPAPAPISAAPASPALEDSPSSNNGNFDPYHGQSAPSSHHSSAQSNKQQAPAPHHNLSAGKCTGLLCITDAAGLPNTGLPAVSGEHDIPNPGFVPVKSFDLPVVGGFAKPVSQTLGGASGHCESGDLSVCADGSTGDKGL